MLGKSSGFELGTSLLSLGNVNTRALSDSKCILSIVHIPALFAAKNANFIEEIVETAIQNLDANDGDFSVSDFQFVVNMSTTTQNQTYLNILANLGSKWAKSVMKIA